jgi:hypothetical protein
MELQEIEVIIGKDGQVQIQVRGVDGLKCLDLTRELEHPWVARSSRAS